MKDTITKRKLRVSTDGTAGPYIMTPVSQIDAVKKVLDAHGVAYSVDEDAISLDDEPEGTVVNLGRGADAKAVQAILDRVR